MTPTKAEEKAMMLICDYVMAIIRSNGIKTNSVNDMTTNYVHIATLLAEKTIKEGRELSRRTRRGDL